MQGMDEESACVYHKQHNIIKGRNWMFVNGHEERKNSQESGIAEYLGKSCYKLCRSLVHLLGFIINIGAKKVETPLKPDEGPVDVLFLVQVCRPI